MKHTPKDAFQGPPEEATALSLIDAIELAKTTVTAMTGLTVDTVVKCTRVEADAAAWAVTVDVLESPARIGDNDLLSAYELHLSGSGDILHLERLRRYHREDRGAA